MSKDMVGARSAAAYKLLMDIASAADGQNAQLRGHWAYQLRQVDHRAVIAWERIMREEERAAASTVRRRLSALSSLFKHLVRHGAADRNPVADVARPVINREEGSTAAFSKAEARRLLDAPDTLAGLRDRAILSVGLQVGLRRAEISSLTVGDLH